MQVIERVFMQKRYTIRRYVEYIYKIKKRLYLLKDVEEIDKFNLRKGDYKKLVEESYPLAFFVKYHFGLVDCRFIQHCIDASNRSIDNDSYDAEITDENHKNIYYLEVVYPIDGEASQIATQQMIQARKDNKREEMGVSYNGKIDKNLDKPKGQQKYISDNEQRRGDNDYIIEKVFKKNQNNNYFANTILIVSFDDALFHVSNDSFENFKNYMYEQLNGQINRFLFLAFISRSGNYYFEIY